MIGTRSGRERRRAVRRKVDLYVGKGPLYVCPHSLEELRTALSTCITPLFVLLDCVQSTRGMDADLLVQARQAYYKLESLRDALQPCFAVHLGCPKTHQNPWQQFLHWLAYKLS